MYASQQRQSAKATVLEAGPLFLLKDNIESSVNLNFAVMEYKSTKF